MTRARRGEKLRNEERGGNLIGETATTAVWVYQPARNRTEDLNGGRPIEVLGVPEEKPGDERGGTCRMDGCDVWCWTCWTWTSQLTGTVTYWQVLSRRTCPVTWSSPIASRVVGLPSCRTERSRLAHPEETQRPCTRDKLFASLLCICGCYCTVLARMERICHIFYIQQM